MASPAIAIVGTLDTKGEEFAYLQARIEAAGFPTLVIDVGVLGPPLLEPRVTRQEVAAAAGVDFQELLKQHDRGRSMTVMAEGAAILVRRLYDESRISGVVALGGSAGTSVGTTAMRALPMGFPKLMVSTLASGDTRPYVGTKDITMMYSVVDIAGLNRVSRQVLSNAAAAIVGMAGSAAPEDLASKPLVAATMFGVTTPCVTEARRFLEESGFEVIVFHATGTGGRAMEDLISDGLIAGVLDVTTTELADELARGVMSAGPHRLEAAGKMAIPQVVCPGAVDMVNFGPLDSVPAEYRARRLHVHNPTVTLMRTTPEECALLGRTTAQKLNRARGPVTFFLPLGGFSAIARPGEPFYWPEADRSYVEALKANLQPQVRLVELDYDINHPSFARAIATALRGMMAAL